MAAIQRKLVHKQFNSPLGLYSDANVKETLDREMRVISNGTVGIETTDQYNKPVNLANSAVLRMLEEQEAVRKNPAVNNKNDNGRKSRPRHRNIIIDRETVLKINRRHPHRDFSWPPSDDSCRSRSSSEEIHFDDTVCKRNEIFHLKGMFDRGAIDKNKRNISRTLSPKNVQQTKPQDDNNIDDGRSSPFFIGQNIKCHHDWPPRSPSADGESIPKSKTFHIPEEEVHFGMIEPIRKHFERVAKEESENLSSSMKRWKSCENVTQNHHRRFHSPDTSHYSKYSTSQREDKSHGSDSNLYGNKSHPRQASLNRYKSNSYNELPPLKPRAEYNKNLHSGKKKLNLNYSDKSPEKKQTTEAACVEECLDEKLKLATNRRVGENARPTTPGENKKIAISFAKTVEDNNNNNTTTAEVVINLQADSNDRDDITLNKNSPTTKIAPTAAETNISTSLKNNGEYSNFSSSFNKLGTSSTNVTTADEFSAYQKEATNKIRVSHKTTLAPLVSPENYDLASEQKCNAKNTRSHNLCDKINESVNIITNSNNYTSTTTTTTTTISENNTTGKEDTVPITNRPGITSATTVKNSRHIKIAPVIIVEEVNTMGHHHHHPHQHQKYCSEKSTKLYDDTRMYHSRDSVAGTVRNCGDHKTKRDENLQDSAVEQGNITQVVVRRNKQQTNQGYRLKDNDENVKKYHQQEKISKSDLSLSSLDKTDRRRGMYYTDGEYIWGPFDAQKSPFEPCLIDEVKEEEKYKSSQDLRTESTQSQCLNDNSIQISACNLEPISTVHQIRDVHEPIRNEFDMIHIKHSNLEKSKLLDIQKSITEDLRRIDEYMERAERTLSDAEKHLYAAQTTYPQSDSIVVLDTPLEAVIKHIRCKRPSPSPSPSPAPTSFRSISTDKDTDENPPPAPPIRQISYFRTKINEVENMPVVEHALLDLYNISRALDTLNNLTSIIPTVQASSRIVEINDSKDETISQRQSTISPYTAYESGSTSGTESGANIDKVIQSKNILSGYLITKQNQEEVLMKATVATVTDAGVGALFIPNRAEKENRTVIVDLANGKTCHPSKATEGSNDPLKIDEQDSEIQDNGAAVAAARAQLANKSDCDTGNSKQQQVYGVEKSRLDKQLSSHHPEDIQATFACYDILSKSCDDTPNKDNKFIAMGSERHANGAIHDKHFRNGEGVRGDNPNFTPSIHPQKQQTSHDDTGGSGGGDNGYHEPPTNDDATNFHDTEGATTGDSSKASSYYRHQTNKQDIHKTTTKGHEMFVQNERDQRGRSRVKHANDFNLSCKIRSFSSPAAPSSCADFKDETAKNKWKKVGLIRQCSFDRSRNASASPFMTGQSYPTEGYKRVAWPPVSEGSPVRGSTPQSQQTYNQDDQSQITQQYGSYSPQPQEYQHSAPNYNQQSAPSYHQVQHPTQDQTSYYQQQQPSSYPEQDSYSAQGSYPQTTSTYTRQGSNPGTQEQNLNKQLSQPVKQASTVAFSGGVPKKHTPSLPGQPQFQEVICDNPFLPFPTTPGIRSPKGWSHVPPPTSKQTGYTSPHVQNQSGAQQPPFGTEQNSEFNQHQNDQAYQSPVSHQQPQFNQVPHHPQQQQQQQQSQQPQQQLYQPVEQEYYPPQGQQRGQSPGVITLRKEVPITQKPSPLVFSQPAATSFRGGSNMRGDLKWPPPDVKAQINAENEQRVALTKGPAFRPRRVRKDYTQFFAKHALNNTYPGYKIPPGTQHIYAEY